MSEKLRRIREEWENQHPDMAAEKAAQRFERSAVPIPAALEPPADSMRWQRRLYGDAADLYRILVTEGGEGLTITELRYKSIGRGQQRVEEALRLLRASDAVTESRRGVDGFDVDRIVLRAVL